MSAPRHSNPEIVQAREAAAQRVWDRAFDLFKAAQSLSPLCAEDLETYANAAYLTGNFDIAVDARARQHQLHLEDGDIPGAVRAGCWTAFILINSGQPSQAGGWFARSSRLAADMADDAPEQGHLLLLTAFRQVAMEDAFDDAITNARKALELGRVASDEDLIALSLNVSARALIRSGEAEAGLAQLDEAMAAVVSGALSPPVAGTVYCSLIDACDEIVEIRRATEWTDALSRWCERQEGMVAFTGQCLTHRAEVLRHQGELDAAAAAARDACARFEGAAEMQLSGGAWYQLGEVLRIRGESTGAEGAYRRAAERGHQPHPGLALLWLAQGKIAAAETAMRRLDAEWTGSTRRLRMLPALAEVMLAVGDVDAADRAANELGELAEMFGTDALVAYAAQAGGAVSLAKGLHDQALVSLRTATEMWRSLGVVYEQARSQLLVGQVCRDLGDSETASLEIDAARRAASRIGVSTLSSKTPNAHGLTTRELEVLRLVASGLTNREVAEELYISVKTVDRHVASILKKLGVPSRTAATAFAYEHGLI